MELENRMSLGYMKGRYWVADTRFDMYSNRESFKVLTRALRKAGFTFDCSYSYVARTYHCEIITLEQFNGSKQWYTVKHCNSYDPNPMAAAVKAITKFERCTPLLRVVCLEIECELMRDAYKEAVEREKKQQQLEYKLRATLNVLEGILKKCAPQGISHFARWSAVIDTMTVQDKLERTRREAMSVDEDDDL